ncbi:MAG: ral nucleoside transport system permease protein [Frankiaceae bacterium]|nr:ral nucleoside transport system permease protein [Frankiaceae bacterium]
MSSMAERLENPLSAKLRDPGVTGYAGILLGVFAAFLAIPPIQARTVTWPIIVGLVSAVFGIWTVTRGRRRLGWGAVAAGILGIGLGILATRSGVGNLNSVFNAALIAQTFAFATPLIFGAIGGMFSERSGVVNIGLEGMMLMGAFWGVYGADKGGSWVVGILVGMGVGGLLALVYAYFAIHLRADQIVGGTAVNFLALGITGYFFFQLYNGNYIPNGVSTIPRVKIPGISGMHFLGPAIGDLNLMIWAGFVLVIVSYVVVFKTPIGLRIRACGEHPRAADTVGINVYAIRYGCVVLSGMLAALGGVYLSDGFGGGTFINNMTDGRGFIALAAMIFGNWRPAGAFGAALLFGLSSAIALRLQVYSPSASTLFNVLPYVLTLIAVAGVIGRTIPPAADGKPYKKQ